MNRVFVSAGTPADQRQANFRDAIINVLELAGLSPRLMTASDWDYKNPLRGVRRAMQGCCGVVVIAYARYKVESGEELRQGGNKPLTASFPTAWNHIEAAMAYERQLPLLVVAENGLKPDAMFDEKAADVNPFWCDLDPKHTNSEKFKGYLHSWKDDVDAFAAVESKRTRHQVPAELTLFQVFVALPWYEAVAFIATLLGLLFAAATFGYRWGSGQWPFG